MLIRSSRAFLAWCLAALLGGIIAPSARCASKPVSQQADRAPIPVFEFHSGFWLNLHHFLYQQARAQVGAPRSGVQSTNSALSAEERRAWDSALAYYTGGFAERDLLFNGDMVLINDRLGELETCEEIRGLTAARCAAGFRSDLVDALERAAPVYRAHWWTEHDRANREWISAAAPLVRQFGLKLAQQLAETYESDWPADTLRVDVSNYAGAFGAYTSLDPAHLTISSADARNQGASALEVLFHEASHTVAAKVRNSIARECRQRGKPIPRDLWHALLIYTTGELVLRAMSPASRNAFDAGMAKTVRSELSDRGWTNYERALEQYWQPYLDGRADFSTSVARLVSAF